MTHLGLILLTLLVAAIGTGVLRRYALQWKVLDIPNERSSHAVPTPRGGGFAIVSAATVAFVVLGWAGSLESDLLLALVGGGIAVAAVGFMDDRRSLPVAVRITVHFASAVWAIWVLGGVPAIQWGSRIMDPGIIGDVLAVLAIVWVLNLFNFIDGIDGIAASEAVFIAGAGATLCYSTGSSSSVPAAALVIAAASFGFLIWNWPPAKIFMGDVGSGYLGYVLAVVAIAALRENPVAMFVWLILGGIFFVDATVTLVRRLVRGERVYEAHRSHAYQWLARRWGNHRRVTVTVIAMNLFWLLPCAWLASIYPNHAMWIAMVALVPIIVFVILAGAGRSEIKVR